MSGLKIILKLVKMWFDDSQYGLSDLDELFLMSICKNHIIANSSFSWWGAWIGS